MKAVTHYLKSQGKDRLFIQSLVYFLTPGLSTVEITGTLDFFPTGVPVVEIKGDEETEVVGRWEGQGVGA
jgi:hypothetical protein